MILPNITININDVNMENYIFMTFYSPVLNKIENFSLKKNETLFKTKKDFLRTLNVSKM